MNRRRLRPARHLVVLLATVVMILGLSGCFESRQEVRVKADGTGRAVLHAELDKRALATVARTFGRGPVDLQALRFRVVDQTFPDGTRVRTTDDAERSVLDASFDFDGSDDYRRKMEEINEAVTEDAVGSPRTGGSLDVRRVGERMEVAIDLGGLPEDLRSIDVDAMREVLAPDLQPKVTIAVTMPGSILSSNGTVDGRTVTWDLLSTGLPGTLQASSDIARPGLPAWALPAAAGIMLALALAVVGILLSRRSRRARDPVVPYQPGPAQPPGPPVTGFPTAPAGLPPREPLERPQEAAAPSVWAPQQPAAYPPPPPPPPPTPPPPPEGQAATPPAAPPPAAGSADAPPLVPATPSGTTPPDAPNRIAPPAPPGGTPPDAPPATPPPEQPPPRASIWGSKAPAAAAGSSPEEALPWRVAPVAPAERAGEPASSPSPSPDPPAPPPAQPDRTEVSAEAWPPFGRGATPPDPERQATDPGPTAGERAEPEPAATEAVPASPATPAPAATGPVAGWYADPAGSGGLRYWDGSRWTRDTR